MSVIDETKDTAFCGVQWPLVRWPAATKRR